MSNERHAEKQGSHSVQRMVSRLGYEWVTDINPPLHGVTVGWRGHGTVLSHHGEYLLFHYHGGNRTIRTKRQLERVTKFLDDSWATQRLTIRTEPPRIHDSQQPETLSNNPPWP